MTTYQQEVSIEEYSSQLKEMINKLKKKHGYNNVDAMLVLKDILAHTIQISE